MLNMLKTTRSDSRSTEFSQILMSNITYRSDITSTGGSYGLQEDEVAGEDQPLLKKRIIVNANWGGNRSADYESVVEKNGTIFSGIVNLTNTILGAGLLGLPGAVSHTGMILGFVYFLIFAGLSSLGLHFSADVARRVTDTSYYKIAILTFPRWSMIVDMLVAIKCFGISTLYLIVVGDLMPDAMKTVVETDAPHYNLLTSRRAWITVFTVLCVMPTTVKKNIHSLKFPLILCLMCICYVVCIVVLIAFGDNFDACTEGGNDICRGEFQWGYPGNLKKMLRAMPIFILGFECHQNMFAVANEMKNATQPRLDTVISITMFACTGIYIVFAYAGYRSYGNLVESDLLKNLPNNLAVTFVRFVYSVTLSLHYSLQCHPCRRSLSNIFFKKNAYLLPKRYFYMLTGLIVLCSYAVAMSVDDLGIVLGVVGATGSTAISFILPGAFYYKMNKTGKKRYLALALALFGCCMVPFLLTMQFL